MATTRPRYMISVDDSMFEEIENYRFENRFQTRSEATAELLRIGLQQIRKQKRTTRGPIEDKVCSKPEK